MDGRLLTRLTNVVLVAGAGMGAGHVLFPTRESAPLGDRVGFAAVVAGSGAIAAWRERRAIELFTDRDVRSAQWVWLVAGALSALAIAWIANALVHR